MTNPTDDTVNARKLMYLLIAEQKLRPGESMDDAALAHELQRHGFDAATQASAISGAIAQGWLEKGPQGALQLTEVGFRIDLAID